MYMWSNKGFGSFFFKFPRRIAGAFKLPARILYLHNHLHTSSNSEKQFHTLKCLQFYVYVGVCRIIGSLRDLAFLLWEQA